MERLTRVKDEYECRMKNCEMEEYLRQFFLSFFDSPTGPDVCSNCPLMPVANRLADFEDLLQGLKDRFDELKAQTQENK